MCFLNEFPKALFTLHDFKAVYESQTGRRQKLSINRNSSFDWWSTIFVCEHYKDMIKQGSPIVTDS